MRKYHAVISGLPFKHPFRLRVRLRKRVKLHAQLRDFSPAASRNLKFRGIAESMKRCADRAADAPRAPFAPFSPLDRTLCLLEERPRLACCQTCLPITAAATPNVTKTRFRAVLAFRNPRDAIRSRISDREIGMARGWLAYFLFYSLKIGKLYLW